MSLEDPFFDKDQRYKWTCPQCDRQILSWTDYGCALLVKAHKLDHTIAEMQNNPCRAIVPAQAETIEPHISDSDKRFLARIKVRW